MKKTIETVKSGYVALCQKIGAAKVAPSAAHTQVALFALGTTLIAFGLTEGSFAQLVGINIGSGSSTLDDHQIAYNDTQIASAVVAILTMIEGSFGALVMVGSGIAAILSSAFGQYKAALGCLVVAVGSFILRSVMSTFFNTDNIDGLGRP
jgi:hypothetical protein